MLFIVVDDYWVIVVAYFVDDDWNGVFFCYFCVGVIGFGVAGVEVDYGVFYFVVGFYWNGSGVWIRDIVFGIGF